MYVERFCGWNTVRINTGVGGMAVSFLGDHDAMMRFLVRDEDKLARSAASTTPDSDDESVATRNGCIIPMSAEAEARLRMILQCVKRTFHIGFLPLIIYLGWTHGPDQGCPPFSLTNFLCFY